MKVDLSGDDGLSKLMMVAAAMEMFLSFES